MRRSGVTARTCVAGSSSVQPSTRPSPATRYGCGPVPHGAGSSLSLCAVTDCVSPAGPSENVVVTTTFSLGPEGLTQSVTAHNESDEPAPWGTGPHPYLVAGEGRVDGWTLELPATQVLAVTPDRLIPTDLVAVDAEDPERFDFRSSRQIGAVEIDHAYSGLVRDADGNATVRVTAPSGSGVEMSWDAACPWVQVHTADKPDAAQSRLGLAVEPMTCAPDAFNAGSYDYDAGLIVIEPAASVTAAWRIGAIG